jgi:hypothetical protein
MFIADLGSPCRNYAAREALLLAGAVGFAVPLLAMWAVLLFVYLASRARASWPVFQTVDAVLGTALRHARVVGLAYVGALALLFLGGFRYHFHHCPTQDVLRCRQWGELPPRCRAWWHARGNPTVCSKDRGQSCGFPVRPYGSTRFPSNTIRPSPRSRGSQLSPWRVAETVTQRPERVRMRVGSEASPHT